MIAHARFPNSVNMSIVFGIRTKADDPRLMEVLKPPKMLADHVRPGATLFEEFPWLNKVVLRAFEVVETLG